MRVRPSRGCPWWLYICSQLGFTSIFCLLLQVEVLGLAGFVYPLSGLLPWQEPGRPISRTEGSYPRHHRCTPSCCGVSRFSPTPATSAILAGSEIPGVIVITVRVQVCEGVSRVAPESLLRDLRWPWGRLDWLHHQRMCRGIIPVFGLKQNVVEHLFFITALLIDRSWNAKMTSFWSRLSKIYWVSWAL
jgi:hypothetical protein